uniref:Uncharacterized protein n=1 Tax=viral metagenome TaxID=1070528 RepID=A0A6C0HL02_9ZZZZ
MSTAAATSIKEESHFAKRHIRNRFSLMVLPQVSEGIWSVYDNAKSICEKNNQTDQILMTFQNLLTRIPQWTDEVLQTEVKRIIAASKCGYLEELLTGVLLAYLRTFAAVQYRASQDSIEVEFERPPLGRFIHELYKEVARRCWENAFLFRTVGVRSEQQARNRQDIDRIIDTAIDTVLDSFLPWESIVANYFSVGDAGDAGDAESVVSEAAPAAPAPAPSAGPSVVKFAETSDTEDDDDDDASTDSEPPKIQLTEEAVDLEGIADLDEKEEVVDIKVPETEDGSASLVLKL